MNNDTDEDIIVQPEEPDKIIASDDFQWNDAGKSFKGNDKLKGSNAIAFIDEKSYEHYAKELLKCSKDIVYFANSYYYIISTDVGKHIIKTYVKQDELLRKMQKHRKLVVLASRQTFKTTTYCIFCLHTCCFNADKSIVLVANKEKTAKEVLDRIKLAYELLPKWLKPGIKGEWNKTSVDFSNGCSINICSTNATAARGATANILILDEFALVPINIQQQFYTSAYPVISSGKTTKLIIVSTPFGTSNLFYEFYELARLNASKEDGWQCMRVDWWDIPNRDEAWKKQTIIELGNDLNKFNQEFGNVFLGSSYTLINPDTIEKHKVHLGTGRACRVVKLSDKFQFSQWYTPEENHCYCIGVDTSDGVGADYSVISVFDISNVKHAKQVAIFSSRDIKTHEYPYVITKIAKLYNNAALLIEVNSIAKSIVDQLYYIYEYENIVSVEPKHLGILCKSNKIKTEACFNFRKILEDPYFNIELNDPNTVKELEFFEKQTSASLSTFKAAKTKNDDHVMAAIWALYILKNDILENYYDVQYEKIGMENYPAKVYLSYENKVASKNEDEVFKEISKNDFFKNSSENRINNEEENDAEGKTSLGFISD